jgi:hypothetical protein
MPSSFNDRSPAVFPFLLSLKDTNISYNLDYLEVLKLYKDIKKHIHPHLRRNYSLQILYLEVQIKTFSQNGSCQILPGN